MRRILFVAGAVISAAVAIAAQTTGPYKVVKTAKVGGTGNWDYVYADADGRRLYIPRTGDGARVTVFDLDTLAPVGQIPDVNARGVAVDPRSNHGFASSKPVAMFDTKTLAMIKTIDVQGNPDGILFDPFNERVWVFSHAAPHATIIDAKDGSVVGTMDLGGQPEQAASDGAGTLYVDLEDTNAIAVVDAKALQVKTRYDISATAKVPAGLALDAKNHLLFAACRNPALMVILDATSGQVRGTVPIGPGVDGAGFNPSTLEAFSSQGDGTLTVVKEQSATSAALEQTVQTMPSARTMSIDAKTGRIFVIGAQFGPPPAGAPAGRGRGPLVPDSFTVVVVGR